MDKSCQWCDRPPIGGLSTFRLADLLDTHFLMRESSVLLGFCEHHATVLEGFVLRLRYPWDYAHGKSKLVEAERFGHENLQAAWDWSEKDLRNEITESEVELYLMDRVAQMYERQAEGLPIYECQWLPGCKNFAAYKHQKTGYWVCRNHDGDPGRFAEIDKISKIVIAQLGHIKKWRREDYPERLVSMKT